MALLGEESDDLILINQAISQGYHRLPGSFFMTRCQTECHTVIYSTQLPVSNLFTGVLFENIALFV